MVQRQYVKEWGKKNDTEVTVDNVGVTTLNSRAAAEVSAKQGHDLFLFLSRRRRFTKARWST